MKIQGKGTIVRLALAAVCVVLGVLTLAGVLSPARASERWILGAGWIAIGAGWLVRCYLGGQLSGSRSDHESDSRPGSEVR